MANNTAQLDPKTGFIENPLFPYDFDAARKLTFLEIYKQNGLKMHKTCNQVGVKYDTVFKHYNIDPAFKQALERVKEEFFDELEGVSRQNALNPRSVIERIFQLKNRFPNRYGDGKRDSTTNILINVDGKLVEMIKKRQEIIDIEMSPETGQNQPRIPSEDLTVEPPNDVGWTQ